MMIYATSIGSPKLPPKFQAEVHSVFSTVVNLSVQGHDSIVSILFRDENDQPGDVRVDRKYQSVLREFIPGRMVHCCNGRIEISHSSVNISLNQAKLVECTLIERCYVAPGTIQRALQAIDETLRDGQSHSADTGFFGERFSKKIWQSIEGVKRAILANDPGALDENVQQLIGLGPGLTPSGDDVLVGLLAGFEINQAVDPAQKERVSMLGSLVRFHSDKTNQISRKYLRYAANGYFSTRIIDLLTAISHQDSLANMINPANKVLMTGHTSGRDTLNGISAALEILLKSTAYPRTA